jgi:hypothetical protein
MSPFRGCRGCRGVRLFGSITRDSAFARFAYVVEWRGVCLHFACTLPELLLAHSPSIRALNDLSQDLPCVVQSALAKHVDLDRVVADHDLDLIHAFPAEHSPPLLVKDPRPVPIGLPTEINRKASYVESASILHVHLSSRHAVTLPSTGCRDPPPSTSLQSLHRLCRLCCQRLVC